MQPRGGQTVHPDYAGAARQAVALIDELGHVAEEARPDVFDDAYDQAFGTAYGAAFPWIIEYWIRKIGRQPSEDEIEPRSRAFWEHGRGIPTSQYLLAIEEIQRIGRRFDAFFDRYDVWMTPALGGPPVELGTMPGTETDPMRGNDVMGTFLMFDGELANMTGIPAMSVPLFIDSEGLPIGISFMARFGDEATLFRLAAQLENAKPWAGRRPAIHA
jgi:amidase